MKKEMISYKANKKDKTQNGVETEENTGKQQYKDEIDESFENLGENISNLLGNIMGSVGKIFTGISESEDFLGNLEKFGEDMKISGEDFEDLKELKKLRKEFQKMGKLGKLGAIFGGEFGKNVDKIFSEQESMRESPERSSSVNQANQEKRNRDWINKKKEQVKDMLKFQKRIAVDEISEILEIPPDQAEILIYELVGEGINGTLEEGVFIFTDHQEKVLSLLYKYIEKLKKPN